MCRPATGGALQGVRKRRLAWGHGGINMWSFAAGGALQGVRKRRPAAGFRGGKFIRDIGQIYTDKNF